MTLLPLVLLALPMGGLSALLPRQTTPCTTTTVLPVRTETINAPLETVDLAGLNGPNQGLGGDGNPNGLGGLGNGQGGAGGLNGGAGGAGGLGAPGNGPPYTTVYPIVVETFGPNGAEEHTYLVTQICPTWPCMPATGIPPGFTASVATCNVCGPSPVTATLTVPAEGTPAVSIKTYERVYDHFCETGLGPSTYVITQTCPGEGACSTPASTIVPPNFTAVQSVCNAGCGPTPITATLTVPIITAAPVATGTGVCVGCAAPTATFPVMAGAPKAQQGSGIFGVVAGVLSLTLLVAGLL